MSNKDISELLQSCMLQDRFALKRRFFQLQKNTHQQDKDTLRWQQDLEESAALLAKRQAIAVHIDYPDLPVSEKRDDIKALIDKHQVVIVAGETGSGKTTQLPKMCLELGRGRAGMIAHTQPRRLAARSVSSRIAEELQSEVGQTVGFKVRFSDKVSDASLVKLLTDGMLLAEIQTDRFLNQYDTIIIDEAHERSLNIDFLLGYLKTILPKRPDLKLIITSATIDPQRFSRYFNDAPCLQVSGRSFPVEIRHKNYVEEKLADDQTEAIKLAVDELFAEGKGDILVFLSSEREIRETQTFLKKQQYRHTEVIPLYARLSASDQQKIFHPQGQRRIILSTNVAETSLTVPGIKYVIDTGLVRMSRYSHRLKVQRLPIEAISQASAKQRAGRCGRVSNGICIRLYDENDFESRPEFTDPEITRTHLSSVILQMLSLGLGDIDKFEFIQAPQEKFIKDGVRLLLELEAVSQHKGLLKLTPLGRHMSRLPLDPKYARILLQAKEFDCVNEAMIITAGLSIQDPRERPHDSQQKADTAHEEFTHKQSDLLSLLNLFLAFKEQQKELSQNQLRKWCTQRFIHFQRMREWQDTIHQVKQMLVSVGLRLNSEQASYDAIHQSMLSGLLSQVGTKDINHEYLGARNSVFKIFPGSSLFKTQPKWIMAAELVETSNLYARQVSKIEPQWIESAASHLLKYNYADAHWSKKRGAVMAYMNALLFGLPVVTRRLVNYSKVNMAESRALFIRHALVQGETKLKYAFLDHNLQLIEDVHTLEKKVRRRDILVDEEDLVDFYDQQIGHSVCSEASFRKWWSKLSGNGSDTQKDDLLKFDPQRLVKKELGDDTKAQYPDFWQQHQLVFPLQYEFEPNKDYDGVCVRIPIEQLNQVQNVHFDWLVPGIRHELVVALIKSLPKKLRRNFVPAPDYASACLPDLHMLDKQQKPVSITQALAQKLFKMSGVKINPEDFEFDSLDSHLTFSFAAVNEKGEQVALESSLARLKDKLKGKLSDTIKKAVTSDIEKEDIDDFVLDEIPQIYTQEQNGFTVKAYPAVQAKATSFDIKMFTSLNEANQHHKQGIVKLLKSKIPSPVKYLQQKLPNKSKLNLYFNPFGQIALLIDDIINASIYELLLPYGGPQAIRKKTQFKEAEDKVRMNLNDKALSIAAQVEIGLSTANQIQKLCKGKIPINLINNYGFIKQHLGTLVYKGFVFELSQQQAASTIEEALQDWNRYLKALLMRTEKLKIDANRDRINQIELDKALDLLEQAKKTHQQQLLSTQVFKEVEEMIEELRISLFAQQLGTKYPISLKRIRNKLDEIASSG